MNTKPMKSSHLGAALGQRPITVGESTTTAGGATLRRRLLVIGFSLLLAVGLSGDSVAQAPAVYDAFSGFSFVSNPTPDGVWSYGYSLDLGGTLNLYTMRDSDFSLSIWERPGARDPNVIKNETGAEIVVFGAILFPTSDFLHFHPGPNGEFSVIRWTAPTSGRYRLETTFRSLRIAGANTTTDVNILKSCVPQTSLIFSGLINSNQDVLDFSTETWVNAGDSLDFAVGIGANNDFSSDSTGIRAIVTLLEAPQTQIQNLIAQVQQLVDQGVLNPSQGSALRGNLLSAIEQLDNGNVQAASRQLQAFVRRVNALITARVLTPAQGQPLIGAAEAIINQLVTC